MSGMKQLKRVWRDYNGQDVGVVGNFTRLVAVKHKWLEEVVNCEQRRRK